jgi:hypothetical protein
VRTVTHSPCSWWGDGVLQGPVGVGGLAPGSTRTCPAKQPAREPQSPPTVVPSREWAERATRQGAIRQSLLCEPRQPAKPTPGPHLANPAPEVVRVFDRRAHRQQLDVAGAVDDDLLPHGPAVGVPQVVDLWGWGGGGGFEEW